jgi:DNA polymerase III epsilon subunit-like protein
MFYYVLDVETTGLKCDWHEVTEISLIRCSDRHQLTKYIKAEHPWRASPEALSATGRTKQDLLKGISKFEAVEA